MQLLTCRFDQYSVTNGQPSQHFFENQPDAEATRLFQLELRLVRRCAPLPADSSPYPPLLFIGKPKGVISSRASVEGTVTMGADGVVRWQFVRMVLSHHLSVSSYPHGFRHPSMTT